MIRPQVACRAMWRRANSLIIRAASIASTVNSAVQVPAVTGCRDRPRWSDGEAEAVGHPSGRVVDQDVDRPESLLGGVEQQRGAAGSDKSAFTAAARAPPSRMRAMTAAASCARWSR